MPAKKARGANGHANGANEANAADAAQSDKNACGRPCFRVLIVGAGQMGAFYDQPGSEEVLSHAHAFHRHPGFELAGFMDADAARAEEAVAIWGGRVFASLGEAYKARIDVVSLAVPDEFHFEYLKQLAGKKSIRVVLAEKPLTRKMHEAEQIRQLFAGGQPAVAVNYLRRFVPEFQDLQRQIASGECGEYLTGTGYYGKGLVHNGSHLLDLLRFLLGNIKAARPVYRLKDHYHEDPSWAAVLCIEGERPFFLQAVDSRPYALFEIDLLFTRRRVRIVDSGFAMEIYDVFEDPTFPGYHKLEQESWLKTSLDQAMYLVADNIYRHLANGLPLACTLEEAFQVMADCEQIKGAPFL